MAGVSIGPPDEGRWISNLLSNSSSMCPATRTLSAQSASASESPVFCGGDPFNLQIVDQLPFRHANSLSFLDRESIGFDLRRGIDVTQFWIEQGTPFAKLPDVAQFMHEVEIDRLEFRIFQVMGADNEVAVDVACPHIAEPRGEEFDLQVPKHAIRLRTK